MATLLTTAAASATRIARRSAAINANTAPLRATTAIATASLSLSATPHPQPTLRPPASLRSASSSAAHRPPPTPQQQASLRSFTTSASAHNAPEYSASNLDERSYHALSNGVLDSLTEQFEALIEDADIEALEERAARQKLGPQRGAPTSEWDVECATGVMNLRLGPFGTYVINKQPPNKQIWLSSPHSGPKRFDYDEKHHAWFSLKEGQLITLKELLDTELAVVFDTTIDLELDSQS